MPIASAMRLCPPDDGMATAGTSSVDQGGHDRIDALERKVAELQAQVAAVTEMVQALIDSGAKGS